MKVNPTVSRLEIEIHKGWKNVNVLCVQGQGETMESVVRLYDVGRLRAEEEDQEEEEEDRNEEEEDDTDNSDDGDMDQDDDCESPLELETKVHPKVRHHGESPY